MKKMIAVNFCISMVFAATTQLAKNDNLKRTNISDQSSTTYTLPQLLLLNNQELQQLARKHPEVGPVGSIMLTAKPQETNDMVCTLEQPKQCYGGYPIERAKNMGWSFEPNNTFERNELVLAPYEQTKYIIGVVVKKETSEDATYAVQIGETSVVYMPAHSLGKKVKNKN